MVNGSWLEDFERKAWKIQKKFLSLHVKTKMHELWIQQSV